MKKIFLLGLCWVMVAFAQAQSAKVVDRTSLQPVAFAEITVPNSTIKLFTNEKGEFTIPSPEPAELIIWHPDYRTVTVKTADIAANKGVIYLSPQIVRLDEVVISPAKVEEKRTDVAQQVDVVSAEDMAVMNAQNSGDVLTQTGNVLVQKSQQGGGSPIIRGFEANKVLMVVDGIRLNNAIYRGGHLQNVIRMDNNMLDKVEVVFGPGSTIYGSDALGGVIHFHTRKVMFSPDEKLFFTGSAFTRFSTVNEEKTGHFTFNLGGKKWAWMMSATYSDFGDLRQGNLRNPFYNPNWIDSVYAERINGKDSMIVNKDPNVQVYSRYKQYNIMQKIAFRPNDHSMHLLNFQYTTTSDVFRYDRLQEVSGGNPASAEWYYGPEQLLIAAYQYTNTKKTTLYDRLSLSFNYQNVNESRHSRKFNKTNRKDQIEHVDVIGFNADFLKNAGKNEIRYGVDFSYNKVTSTAKNVNVNDLSETPTATRYPDGGSTMMWAGAYISHNLKINDKLILTDGLRFSYVGLDATFADTSIMHFPFTAASQTNSAITGNIGLIMKPCDGWRVMLMGSTGFRAPNVDDMGKVFDSAKGATLVVPNAELKPEYTYNADLTVEKTFGSDIRISATGFYTYVKDVIALQPFTLNGADSVVYDGVLTQVVANQNATKGYIYGTSLNFAADISECFSITSTVNFTYARVKTDTTDYPMDHIPPVYGRTGFVLNLKKFRSEFYVMYNGWKRVKDYNMYGEDNFVQSTPYGTPAWCTLNLRTSYQINKYIRVQAALENILDQNYRVFASGISAPGRNFSLTLRANF